MVFRFYINDIETNEPIGFDATTMKLVRSEKWHGVMAEFSKDNFEIYGSEHKETYKILKDLYDEFGIDAVATFRVEYNCSDEEPISREYSITFYESEWYCGENCYCVVGLQRIGCIYQLTNAMDTKVNLDTTLAIDGTTDLQPYGNLGTEILVPSKAVLFQDNAIAETDIIKDFATEVTTDYGGTVTGSMLVEFFLPFDKTVLSELETFVTEMQWTNNNTSIDEDVREAHYIYKAKSNNIQCSSFDYDIILKSSGTLYIDTFVTLSPINVKILLVRNRGATNTLLVDTSLTNTGSTTNRVYSWNVDYSDTINLIEGDRILAYILINAQKTTSGNFDRIEITQNKDAQFKITSLSLCEDSTAKQYLINESISRVTEYVTNNCLKVYSEYLGRKDSQPFSFDNDGCGGMLSLTKGVFLRQLEKAKDTTADLIISLSFNDIMTSLSAIEQIGFSLEIINGEEVLRVENWDFFYNDTVVVDIGTVSVQKKPNLKMHFKNYKTGYSKYEAEEYNGLDEFLTEREYATKLINHNETLDKVCQFIASGYAIEITRRKGNKDSKDWRFDNDTFIICLYRNVDDLAVEQGNITNSENIISPETILNFRISPSRMAMNWFKYATTFIKGVKELVFSSGKGNVTAKGELINDCKLDLGVIQENQNIKEDNFLDDIEYFSKAELHTISDVPFSFEQSKAIELNPHGLIKYSCDGVDYSGWINKHEYSFAKGSADFELIPKVSFI